METTDTTKNELTMLVGTYTSGTSKGIYSYRFNEKDGTATPLSETEIENPSYLVPSADGKFVYAVSEFNNEQAAANAFAFNKEKGTLELLNSQQTGGEDPCYIIASGNNVITANYSGGSISVFPIAKDGSLLPTNMVSSFFVVSVVSIGVFFLEVQPLILIPNMQTAANALNIDVLDRYVLIISSLLLVDFS